MNQAASVSENAGNTIEVTFWGVRGSRPTPTYNNIIFGGNTCCIQITTIDYNFIFDAGTGIIELGEQLLREQEEENKRTPLPIEADIFFSHYHWDHIHGLPFFAPIYEPGNHFRLYGEDKDDLTFQQIIERQLQPPYFPITMEKLKADYEFINIRPNQTLTYQGINNQYDTYIKTFPVNHPNGCLAFRIESGGNSVVFCTDTEPFETEDCEAFCQFIAGTDVFIYDTHFSAEEYFGQNMKHRGHSTWEEGISIAQKAMAGNLVLFHHKENRSDSEQQEIEIYAQQQFANTVAAREGMRIKIGGDCPEKVAIYYPS